MTKTKRGGVVDNKLTLLKGFLTSKTEGKIPTTALELVTQAGLISEITQHEKNQIDQETQTLEINHSITYQDAREIILNSISFIDALCRIYNLPSGARNKSHERINNRGRSKSRGRSKNSGRSKSRGRSGNKRRAANN